MRQGYLRTFWIFLAGGFGIIVAIFSLILISDVIWVDFFYDNPHRTRADSLILVALSPLHGIIFAIVLKLLPLLIGAGLAVLGRAIFGYLPFWYLIAILPVCWLADEAQGCG